MHELYDIAIAPVLRAAGVATLVEIGALKGETSRLVLDLLGPDGELHVIEPDPRFDADDLALTSAARVVLHVDLSLNVLPRLPAVDAALIDGDHNWYTVFHELKALAATARDAGTPLPIIVMHDVGWPYGRRDLYYDPATIPDEYRQSYERSGMVPGDAGLVRGGVNPDRNNAAAEGGPRNGVMTALDDFLAEHDRPVRSVVLPVFFGLAIVVEQARLDAHPELAGVLDRLEGAEGRGDLLALAEELRLEQLARKQRQIAVEQSRVSAVRRRYLDVVKRSVLDEHYIENEVRLRYLTRCLEGGEPYDRLKVRDPAIGLERELERAQQSRQTSIPASALPNASVLPYTTLGHTGLDHIERCLATIRAEGIAGDVAVCGVWRGGSAIYMRAVLEAFEMRKPKIWLADTFHGSVGTIGSDSSKEGLDLVIGLNTVREGLARFDLFDDRVRFLQGPLHDTLADAPIGKLALLHIGTTSPQDTSEILDALYDRVASDGFVIVEHDDVPDVGRVIEEFRSKRGIADLAERYDASGISWRKTAAAQRPTKSASTQMMARPPLAPPVPVGSIALSVIVVFHNMRREAMRTLHSLTRSYQRGIEDVSYEVVVIDNGSSEDQRLTEEFVHSFGPEFRYLALDEEAHPSPAYAMNRGISLAKGESLALMIDGAHVLTPGVLQFGLLGLRMYPPALVATHQWYVGPGQQGDAMNAGYDREAEDRLFDAIAWPSDGYRLFEVGQFIGERDWFDGCWESNCLFTPRALLEQVGGFDETFATPGGGYTNLDLFERLGATPGVTLVNIMGEASFHQLHGGTTTNQPDIAERHDRLVSYREQYQDVKGRPFGRPPKTFHFVGSLVKSARRSRARRTIPTIFKQAQRTGSDGLPDKPLPIPDELKVEFVDSFWRSLAWHETNWLGRKIRLAPTDLFIYQEIIARVRPDWIVETRTGNGHRAMFLASICELLGHGKVLSVHAQPRKGLPKHRRLQYLEGEPTAADVCQKIFSTVGKRSSAMVLLGSRRRNLVVKEFELLAPLVPVGSYVIVEMTVVNGHPVHPEHGPGPFEAVSHILRQRRDFAVDPELERYALTFSPKGFLKRVE